MAPLSRSALLGAAMVLGSGSGMGLAPPAQAREHRASSRSRVALDGVATEVRWTDGDTFRVLEGQSAGQSARGVGYNALESYGPVHRWGGWRPSELLANARQATRVAMAGSWSCRTLGGAVDRYRRLLVSCPDAARTLVSAGLAMVFAVEEEPSADLLAAQREAQARGAGMWARGVPEEIPTSLHAAGEVGGEEDGGYDRTVDARTGRSTVRRHRREYAACQEVCVGEGAAQACMVYVPYPRRYRDRPACLLATWRAGGAAK